MLYPRRVRFWVLFLLTCIIPTILVSTPAQATIITATEIIEDTVLIGRDLRRTRTTSLGFNNVQGTDATIIAENSVDGDFAFLNTDDVTYTHLLSWLPAPLPVGGFLTASLSITAVGALGSNDIVFADGVNKGALANNLLSMTTVFSINVADLVDNTLNILIDKNLGAGFPGNLNLIHITRSELTVTYDTVPEPTSFVLTGSGLLLLGWMLKKRRQGQGTSAAS